MTTTDDTLHDRIAERAHDLWERAGRPHYRSAEFWHQARNEIEDDQQGDDPVKPAATHL